MMRGSGGAVAGENVPGSSCINYSWDSFVMWKKHKGQKLFDHFHLFVCLWFFFGVREFAACLFV